MSSSDRRDPVQGEIVHEYDGILEADNKLPRWWLGIFFGSIAFSIGYWVVYEQWERAPYPVVAYRDEMAAAAAAGGAEVTDQLLEMLAQDTQVTARGREVYETNCVVCHGARAEGVIGPNLTDPNWLHGGAPTDIHRTIRDGVGERGMPAWGSVLGQPSVQALAAYVLTIRDTQVPGRAPQGEVWTPGSSAPTPATHDTPSNEASPPGPTANVDANEPPAPLGHAVPVPAVEASLGASANLGPTARTPEI